MKRFRSFLIYAALVALAAPIAAQDTASPANVSIRFFNRAVYYPGNSPTEPVNVQISISNDGPETLRFKLAEDHAFSLDFFATDARNQPLAHTEEWQRKRNTSRQIYFREISLEPGETYSFVENVKDYLAITGPGMFVLNCAFYPELKRNPDDSESSFKSNRLTLEVKPSPGAAAVRILPVSPTTGDVLQPEAIPPDQVVATIITARQRSQWNQFFIYIDLEKMLARDPAKDRRYRAESEQGRYRMLEDYRSELMNETSNDREISTIPVEFQIERTEYAGNKGTVEVIEWFKYSNFREKKRYTYELESRDGIWRVYGFSVQNLGTE